MSESQINDVDEGIWSLLVAQVFAFLDNCFTAFVPQGVFVLYAAINDILCHYNVSDLSHFLGIQGSSCTAAHQVCPEKNVLSQVNGSLPCITFSLVSSKNVLH